MKNKKHKQNSGIKWKTKSTTLLVKFQNLIANSGSRNKIDTPNTHIHDRSFSMGASWPWSYGRWIYDYLCNWCLSPLMLWVRISVRAKCTTLCDKVCQWIATGQWFSLDPPVSSTNKTDRHDITEVLLKMALNTIKQTNQTTSIKSDSVKLALCAHIFFLYNLTDHNKKDSMYPHYNLLKKHLYIIFKNIGKHRFWGYGLVYKVFVGVVRTQDLCGMQSLTITWIHQSNLQNT